MSQAHLILSEATEVTRNAKRSEELVEDSCELTRGEQASSRPVASTGTRPST